MSASRKAGVISINLNAGTAQFLVDMDRANAKIGAFGQRARETSGALRGIGEAGSHSVSGVQATSGALRVLEGGLSNNLRAAERFTANVLGLGPILQKAFPLIGGLAFAGLIITLGEEVKKFYTNMRDAPEKITGGFRVLNASARQTNDELELTNVKLANQIAKLEGRHQDVLKEELYEARVEADKLAESLDKGIKSLHELLKSNEPSGIETFRNFMAGAPPVIQRLTKEIGGQTGSGGFDAQIAGITATGNRELTAAAHMPTDTADQKRAADLAKEAAQRKMNTALLVAYEKQIQSVNEALGEMTRLQQKQWTQEAALLEAAKKARDTTQAGFHQGGVQPPETNIDWARFIEPLTALQQQLNLRMSSIDLGATQSTLTSKLRRDEAKNASDTQERPVKKMTDELTARVAEAAAKLKAAGQEEAGKAIAKGMAEALAAIQRVNEGLAKQHMALLPTDPTKSAKGREFLGLTTQEATLNAEATFKNKVQEVNSKLADQLQNQRAINDAIGKGWEALAKVNVEIALQRDLGAVLYSDPGHAAEVHALREKALTAEIAKHVEDVGKGNMATRDEITLETNLARAQSAGAEAVRLATLQHKIAIMERNGATKESIELEKQFYAAQRASEVSKQIADIDQQIAALKRLTAAYGQGAEAVRKAELENKLEALKRQGPASITGSQAIVLANTEAENKAAEAAGKRVTLYADQLAELQRETEALDKIKVTEENRNDIERARRDILDAELKIIVEQDLAQKRAIDGVHAFFTEMHQGSNQAKQAYDALNSALDQTSENLMKLMTGQKTSWAKEFQGIGNSLFKGAIKDSLQRGLVRSADSRRDRGDSVRSGTSSLE